MVCYNTQQLEWPRLIPRPQYSVLVHECLYCIERWFYSRNTTRTAFICSNFISYSQLRKVANQFTKECWVGPGNKAIVVSWDYLSSCTSSMPWFLFRPGLTQPVFILLCCFNSAECCHVQSYVFFCVLLRGAPLLFAGSFAGHFKSMIVPYQQHPKLHFKTFHIYVKLVNKLLRNLGKSYIQINASTR